jgi:hypothetical protein
MAKKASKKAQKITRENLILATAITSLLFNLFFISAVVIYRSTSKFDYAIYTSATAKYCDDYSEIKSDDSSDTPYSSEVAFALDCRSGQFAPYYEQAKDEYIRDLGY